ncbi:MAG: hypothetical protein JWN15_4241 [Firmicutes bacterium]|nr:hypothetical protein [Bacillota bacterium]
MTQLGCNYSQPLLSFLAEGEVAVDWIKLSREDTLLREVAECRSIRPALVHTLRHAGMSPEAFSQIDWDELNFAIAACRSPHVAIHLQSMAADWDFPVDPAVQDGTVARRVLERMITHILAAQERLHVPLLLENIPLGGSRGNLWICARPATICEALAATDTGLLLDTAHLRSAAWYLGMDPHAYALALPLERVREIHVTGPRLVPGEGLRDRHRELLEEDYALLAWLLERTSPAMVTLEYGGTGPTFERPGMTDPEALRRQLHRLKGMLA